MKPTPYRGGEPFIFVSCAYDDADRVSGKQHVLFPELGHVAFPRNRFNGTVVDWLDQQFGPVR